MQKLAVSAYVPPRTSFPSFAALRAFDAAARLGGIRRAADILGLDPAVISRHVRELEAWTGTDLLLRNHVGVTLTGDGLAYHARIAAALDEIASATTSLMQRRPRDRCTIWVAAGYGMQWLASRIGQFQAMMPDIHVSLRPSDEMPRFMSDEADIDIRFRTTAQMQEAEHAGLRMAEIVRPPVFPVASPGYLAATPALRSAHDMMSHVLLHRRDGAMWHGWFGRQGVDVDTDALPGARLWNMQLVLNAACQGQGIALANPFLVADELRERRLCVVPCGPDEEASGVDLGAYVFTAPADRWHSPTVARFRRWLLKMSCGPTD